MNLTKQLLLKYKLLTFTSHKQLKKGYLSFYIAMQFHQIYNSQKQFILPTLKLPNHYKASKRSSLEQSAVDSALKKNKELQRKFSHQIKTKPGIYLFKNNFIKRKVGVIDVGKLKYTDLECTVIDISVRPAYGGGIFEILEAF